MTDFRDVPSEQRFEQGFADSDGELRRVWADYAVQGDIRRILHVEAEPALRDSGASGQFMQALAEHARAEGLKLHPVCGYAVAWLKRHRDYHDVVAD